MQNPAVEEVCAKNSSVGKTSQSQKPGSRSCGECVSWVALPLTPSKMILYSRAVQINER